MSETWNTIESDPGVFTEMIKNLQCEDIQFYEIYSFEDEEIFKRIEPIEGYILLFQYDKKAIDYMRSEYCYIETEEYPDLFFAHQIVNNACATQAILNVLLNIPHINIGPVLQTFKNETINLNADARGRKIGENEIIRKNHNEFSQPTEYLERKISEKFKNLEGGKAYHFIGIVPYNGILLLLDGYNECPLILGGADEDWYINGVKEFFNGLIQVMEGNLEFTFLAICHDQIKKYKMLYDEAKSSGNEELMMLYSEILKDEEEVRRNQWKENRRRKHDYMGLALNSLLLLGKYDKLNEQLEEQENELKKIKK